MRMRGPPYILTQRISGIQYINDLTFTILSVSAM